MKSDVTAADKPLEFVGSSKEDLSAFPLEVKRCVGFALRSAQKGGKHPDARPLKGFGGAGVLEVNRTLTATPSGLSIPSSSRV